MSRDFAGNFYKTQLWENVRASCLARAHGLCERCGSPASVAHHIEWLTPKNITDQRIRLGLDNLMAVCRDCHAKIHIKSETTQAGLEFDSNGDLIPAPMLNDNYYS